MNLKVDSYIEKSDKLQAELKALQSIMLECGLTEDFKWRNPCYTFNDKNIIILGRLKESCILSFLKGVLLTDSKGILKPAGPNSRSAKIISFTNVDKIHTLKNTLRNYIFEAIEIERLGLKVNLQKEREIQYPEELQLVFKEKPLLKTAFENLTPGRQRGYILYFESAKQSKTRSARIKKYEQRILNGKGFHDCVCGLSKKMPACDGSHKKY
ncbi:MAG: YdeI/OmpD-associated family protein [Patiriisocius sp.]|uniref:YdeI/OmpD-associated family protein n=1 Tax=Patiriisocius sp. TaxID=2822396 RepID=UPI003EF5093C